MDHTEIRTIRGSLSRPAFARLLGVTPLTVLRWELPEGTKEARRPRAKMIENLRRLASEGVGARASEADAPDEVDEDHEASEPVADSAPSVDEAPAHAPTSFDQDQRLVQPLLDQLAGEGWARAEDELLGVLAGATLATAGGRALASIGIAQAQLFGRRDLRGALTTLLPIFEGIDQLPPAAAARGHVMGALLFSTRDSRFFDAGRVNAHAARAEELLSVSEGEGEDDQRVFLALARVGSARFLDPRLGLHAYQSQAAVLGRARSPLAQLIVLGLRAVAAFTAGDSEGAGRARAEAFASAERLGMSGLTVVILADRCQNLLRGAYRPEAVLGLVQRARQQTEAARLPMNESFVIALAAEIDALGRSGRVSEAAAVAGEAMKAAHAAGVARYALAMPVARLYVLQCRVPELSALADELEAEAAGSSRGLADIHATLVRAFVASLAGDYPRAIELAERVCSAPKSTPGIDYLLHDAHVELTYARLLLRDLVGTQEALRRNDALLKQRPSVWHSAMGMRLHGYLLMRQGRFAEARQKFEATVATFAMLGDVIQLGLSRATLGILAIAAGAPDGEARLEDARKELRRYCDLAPEMTQRSKVLSVPVADNRWQEPSLTERLVVAVDRLSVLSERTDLLPRELGSILTELFPGREAVVGGEGASDVETVALGREGGALRVGVRGALDPEQRAALRLLATIAPLVTLPDRATSEPEVAIDTVLPGFIAVAPATRKLKSEVAQLSRSSATILITGESGTGKEVVARALHELSARAERPYVVFNCASVPRELFESQLFGHRRGAFTGATGDNLGVIRAADGGTLFLDEIGELPMDTQPKLLRFLENGEVLPIGEQQARRVDVRILAATHRDLARQVRESLFREDLYYRLNVVPLRAPPLRERKEDVPVLARFFVSRLAPQGSDAPELARDAIAALMAHSWPGNVRELRNVLERAMAYAPVPRVLHAEHLRITA